MKRGEMFSFYPLGCAYDIIYGLRMEAVSCLLSISRVSICIQRSVSRLLWIEVISDIYSNVLELDL